MLTLIALVVCIVATVISDYFGEPPNYLVALLGTAAGAFFAAIGSDQTKRTTEVRETAERAERKADHANADAAIAKRRADDSETRESGWSKHRDHDVADAHGEGEG